MPPIQRLLELLALLSAAGCSALPHRPPAGQATPAESARRTEGTTHAAGDSFVEASAYYGIPILQKSFFWDGNGETDVFGLGVHAFHCLDDRIALGLGLDVSEWLIPRNDAYSAELEGILRLFPFGQDLAFVDFHAGYVHATEPVPPGGTDWNFTFGFGPGVDLPLGEGSSLLFGVDYHHTSNALGRMSDRNPSQNEARIWAGLSWNF